MGIYGYGSSKCPGLILTHEIEHNKGNHDNNADDCCDYRKVDVLVIVLYVGEYGKKLADICDVQIHAGCNCQHVSAYSSFFVNSHRKHDWQNNHTNGHNRTNTEGAAENQGTYDV